MSAAPDFWNLYAREKLGVGETWEWYQLRAQEADNETDIVEIRGANRPPPYASGKHVGSPNWNRRDRSTERRFLVAMGDLEVFKREWKKRTGLCRDCGDTGRSCSGWSATEGARFKPCRKCLRGAVAHLQPQEAGALRRLVDKYPCRHCSTPVDVRSRREIEDASCARCTDLHRLLNVAGWRFKSANDLRKKHHRFTEEGLLEATAGLADAVEEAVAGAKALLLAVAKNDPAKTVENARWCRNARNWLGWSSRLAVNIAELLEKPSTGGLEIVARSEVPETPSVDVPGFVPVRFSIVPSGEV